MLPQTLSLQLSCINTSDNSVTALSDKVNLIGTFVIIAYEPKSNILSPDHLSPLSALRHVQKIPTAARTAAGGSKKTSQPLKPSKPHTNLNVASCGNFKNKRWMLPEISRYLCTCKRMRNRGKLIHMERLDFRLCSTQSSSTIRSMCSLIANCNSEISWCGF